MYHSQVLTNIGKKEHENLVIYQGLREELEKMWKENVIVVLQ